jgi:hypothetical protein
MLTTSLVIRSRRIYAAKLQCGYVLTYEASTFVPDVGEVVPCRRHGFCRVTSREGGDGRGMGTGVRNVHPRSQSELMAFLRQRPVTTVHALRRARFSLRLVTAAQKNGLVAVDLLSGQVLLCSPARGATTDQRDRKQSRARSFRRARRSLSSSLDASTCDLTTQGRGRRCPEPVKKPAPGRTAGRADD